MVGEAYIVSANLTQGPQVPNTTESLLLSFSYSRTVTTTPFPFLEQLQLPELGTQFTPLTTDKEAFPNLPNLRILDLGKSQIEFLHPDCDEDEVLKSLKFSLFTLFAVTLTLFLVAILIVTKSRGFCFICYKKAQRLVFKYPIKGRESETYKYDAYLCFSSKDFEWVRNALLKHLDAQYSDRNRFNLCFEERDFLPGENHIANIQDALWSSRKVVCLVSRHFLRDGWCLEAFSYAQSRCLADLSGTLIMVVVGSLSQYQLMKHRSIRGFVQKQQYLRWPEDLQDVGWFLNKLSQLILKKEKERKKDNDIQLQSVTTIS
ncbi:toll-like receptor 5 [Pontoporia blainvillei]|uniref:Toll-like receptor 5 n=1 Tax=Pontoporia blainvillei TaxID=48723 RepID=A0ABX0S7E3_PONBL|nr:toll-like receptor 5 [Pontoporia blainvillei]